jgi:hypothetical protein
MEIYLTRTPIGLKPAYDADLEKMRKVKMGDTVKVELTMPRNVKFHRKFFGLLNIVFDNMQTPAIFQTPTGQEIEIKSVNDLLWHVKMQTGHYEQKVTLGGKIVFEAKSISFASMGEDEFEKFYSDTIDVILKYFLECDKKDLIEMVISDFA